METSNVDLSEPQQKSAVARWVFRLRSEKDFSLFLFAGLFGGIAGGIYSTVFNNFLSDVYNLSAGARGIVEIPREMPGVFIMVVLSLLAFLGDVRIALLATLAAGAGLVGLGLFSPSFGAMLAWMMLYSLGQHMIMPVTPTIGMALSKREEYGARLGRLGAYTLVGTIIAFAFVWVGFNYLKMSYRLSFLLAAAFYAVSAAMLAMMRKGRPEARKVRFVLRRRYMLYYVLCVVSGARNQIFLTFAPWVLIQVFHVGAPVFAVLGVVVAAVSILTRKIVGRAIDVRGERFVLTVEAVLLFAICLGYAFAGDVFPAGVAFVIIAACYVVDNSMSVVEMARSTYVRKIAADPSDVTPTLSAGVSLTHIVSMSVPSLGGMLWAAAGYQYVFLAAAAVALLNLVLSCKIETAGISESQNS